MAQGGGRSVPCTWFEAIARHPELVQAREEWYGNKSQWISNRPPPQYNFQDAFFEPSSSLAPLAGYTFDCRIDDEGEFVRLSWATHAAMLTVPDTKMLVLLRTNVIKAEIGGMGTLWPGKVMRYCRKVMKGTSQCEHGRYAHKGGMWRELIKKAENRCTNNRYLLRLATSEDAFAYPTKLIVHYEALQLDVDAQMRSVAAFLNIPNASAKPWAAITSTIAKGSPESLHDWSGYVSAAAFLRNQSKNKMSELKVGQQRAAQLLQMLSDTTPRVYPPC
eukprot:CAMPEP_0119304356 /NCGR_PEP_ID=MMETSP1333-20130426/5597_1 /TAXON_ID=418940 /ORGANISM="Scyphosphaera apsteinii, Strain RCC1455" /LENGTH=275 /DNA_ID=CAMNT_0007307221 /DNA_START=280 /DNA_END=1108 /DNA_ORIENTATION=+